MKPQTSRGQADGLWQPLERVMRTTWLSVTASATSWHPYGEALGFLWESGAHLPQSWTSRDEELGQSLHPLSFLTASEFASYGFNNKLPETQGLKTTEMFSLLILAGQSPQ